MILSFDVERAVARRLLEKHPNRSLTLKVQLAEHGADGYAGRGRDRHCLQPLLKSVIQVRGRRTPAAAGSLR
jgi:hypothetical protein